MRGRDPPPRRQLGSGQRRTDRQCPQSHPRTRQGGGGRRRRLARPSASDAFLPSPARASALCCPPLPASRLRPCPPPEARPPPASSETHPPHPQPHPHPTGLSWPLPTAPSLRHDQSALTSLSLSSGLVENASKWRERSRRRRGNAMCRGLTGGAVCVCTFALLCMFAWLCADTGRGPTSQAELAAPREESLAPGGGDQKTETRYCAHSSFKY